MCIKAADDYTNTLEFVPDKNKTHKAVSKNPFKNILVINIRLNKYVIKLLMIL